MQKDEPIVIEKVGNGFIVSPKSTTLMRLEDIRVFATCDDLKAFLDDHFRENGKPKK